MPQFSLESVQKKFQPLPVGILAVDDLMDAHQLYGPGASSKLGAAWDPDSLLPATVSQRPGGEWFVIRGQRSTRVAEQQEGASFARDCFIYKGLTRQQEARLFLAGHRHLKPVKPFGLFQVLLLAEDTAAVRVEEEVRACGLMVHGSTSTNRVGAVQALLALAEKRPGLVRRALTAMEEAWGRDKSSWDGIMLRAMGLLYDTNWDTVEDARMVLTLKRATVALWKAETPRTGAGEGSLALALAEGVRAQYNAPLRTAKKRLVAPE